MPRDKLEEDGDRFRVLVDAITDHAIFLLDARGRVRTWSSGAERIKGYAAKEIVGEHFSRFYPAEDVEQGKPQRELEQALTEGRFEEEGWRVRKDGGRFWANVVIRPLYGPGGELRGFAKVTRDLTDRKRAQDRLAVLAERERIARELHANTLRLLFGIGLDLQGVAALANDPKVSQRLERCVGQLDEAITELRRFAFGLERTAG